MSRSIQGATGSVVTGPSFKALVDGSLSKTLNPELLPVAVSTVKNEMLCDVHDLLLSHFES